jgi:hypothetical protein
MRKLLRVTFVVGPLVCLVPQTGKTQSLTVTAEDIQIAYSWCIHRYFKHDDGGDALLWKPGRAWMDGFQDCQAIVDRRGNFDWTDRSKHKANIRAIAAAIK